MLVTGLSLQYFRNYRQHTFHFPQPLTVVLGNNAAGKTSLLEALALLSTGESFRATEVQEMIQLDQEIARVKAQVITEEVDKRAVADEAVERAPELGDSTELEVLLTRGLYNGQRVQTRMYSLNNVKKRKKDFVGHILTVVFRPEDLRLIEGSPARRRQFLDTVLKTIDPEYELALKTYDDSLKRRNKLLLQVKEGKMPRSILTFWTTAILKHGSVLQAKRSELLGTFGQVEFPVQLSVEYQPSVMSQAHLDEHADAEIAVGHTLIGPHKDDFVVQLPLAGQVLPIAQYGSRGQQRLAVLWLKMCEFDFLYQRTQTRPLLLLDDILSELDAEHQDQVFSLLNLTQSVITTTERQTFEKLQHLQQKSALIEIDGHA